MVVADIFDQEQSHSSGKLTLVFNTLNRMIKALPVYIVTVPSWSVAELSIINPDIAAWYDRFEKCGGNARVVLWNGQGHDPMQSLKT